MQHDQLMLYDWKCRTGLVWPSPLTWTRSPEILGGKPVGKITKKKPSSWICHQQPCSVVGDLLHPAIPWLSQMATKDATAIPINSVCLAVARFEGQETQRTISTTLKRSKLSGETHVSFEQKLPKNHSSPDPQQSLSCWHLFWSTKRKIFPIKNPGLSFFSRVQAGANFTSRDKKTQARILVPSSRHRKKSRRWGRWAKCIQMSKQWYTLQFNPILKSRKGLKHRTPGT